VFVLSLSLEIPRAFQIFAAGKETGASLPETVAQSRKTTFEGKDLSGGREDWRTTVISTPYIHA
jgi:hypothetical protein